MRALRRCVHLGCRRLGEINKTNMSVGLSKPAARDSFYQTSPILVEGLRRPRLSDKHDWVAIHVLVARRGGDGTAPVVFEVRGGECLRCPGPYEAGFELALLHLHGQNVPLECGPCSAGVLFQNRCQEALSPMELRGHEERRYLRT